METLFNENWLIYALLSVIIFASTQIMDKFCVDDIFKTVRGWVIASGLFAIIPIVGILYKGVPFDGTDGLQFLCLCAGLLQMAAYSFYAKAMQEEGADIIAALWQTLPLYGCLAGVLFLGEVLSFINVIGLLIITGVTVFLSLSNRRMRLKKMLTKFIFRRVFLWMQAACILTLFATLSIDHATHTASTETVFFFYYIGHFIFALGAILSKRKPVSHYWPFLRNARLMVPLVVAMSLIETLDGVGNYALIKAYALGDYGLVTAMEALQPMVILCLVGVAGFFKKDGLSSYIDGTRTASVKIPAFSAVFLGVYILLI